MDFTAPLEFTKIFDLLCDCAVSDAAKERLAALRPSLSEAECRRNMQRTTAAKTILTHLGKPPLASMKEIGGVLELSGKGAMLTPGQLTRVAQFLFTCKRMKSYLKKAEGLCDIAFYGGSIDPLDPLYGEIDGAVRNERVDDAASPALRDIRRQTENENAQIRAKLESLLRGKKAWFSDGYVAVKNGRFTLPVKKECRHQLEGSVVASSSSGATLFIEPASVRRLQEELAELQIREENEIRRILYTLTALVDDCRAPLHTDMEAMESLDFLFAKAKLSEQMQAIPVPVTAERKIVIRAGRHPLLRRADCVPLDFAVGGGTRGVVITGPNTGGKTVALKTVGLLSMMAQCGLHIPAGEGTTLCLHNRILCDIGDGQSIAENLSTFSSHMTRIIGILQNASRESLVLLDELGSGTDPAEGMGIAVAVLGELGRRGCLYLVTTHYPEIKRYAEETPGLTNARMAFDRESLRPLYRLEMGVAGESCALYIAKRLGFPSRLLAAAREAAYRGETENAQDPAPAFCAETETDAGPSGPQPKIEREKPAPGGRRCDAFRLGDCVMVYPEKRLGIVCKPADAYGRVGVQIKKEKCTVSHKRLKLQVPAAELYPPDYDFSIVFDTVANRKARHVMERRHDPDAVVEIEPGQNTPGR